VTTVAIAAQPAATAAANQRVERSLRRIGFPFSPGAGRMFVNPCQAENVSGNDYQLLRQKVKLISGFSPQIAIWVFRNVPEHASIVR
jgi:hypothetical protein